MAKNKDEYINEENGEIEEYPIDPEVPQEIIEMEDEFSLAVFKEYDHIIDLSAKVKEFNEQCPTMKLKDVLNTPFIIKEMKPFTSAFKGQGEVFHCYCQFPDNGQMFRMVIGGGAIIDVLSRAYAAGVRGGFKMEVAWVAGGAYGGYYQLV